MDIQANVATTTTQPGAGAVNSGSAANRSSGRIGADSSGFAAVLSGQQGDSTTAGGIGSAPDAQTTSLLGLLQMLQTMFTPEQNQMVSTNAAAGQGVQGLPSMLLQVLNGSAGFAEQLLQDPNMQAWLAQASAVLQAMAQNSSQSVTSNMLSGMVNPSKLTAQETLLQLSTLTEQQPDNPILLYLLNELNRTAEPHKHLLKALQSGADVNVQQVAVSKSGDGQLQQTKSSLEMLAAKLSGIPAALQHQPGGNASEDAGGSQSSTTDSSPFQSTNMPLQDLLKTLQSNDFKPAAQATIQAQTFVRDMSDFMVKNMKLSLGEVMKEAKLSLNPEHLGQIDVKITLHANGQLIAQLTADSTAGRQLLESQLPQLRQTLQSQGLQVERLEVAQQTDVASNMFGQRQGQGNGQSFARNNRNRAPELDIADGELASDFRTLADFRRSGSNGSGADSSFDVTA